MLLLQGKEGGDIDSRGHESESQGVVNKGVCTVWGRQEQ